MYFPRDILPEKKEYYSQLLPFVTQSFACVHSRVERTSPLNILAIRRYVTEFRVPRINVQSLG
jgi:hypothetical protein